ncbi:MAG: hypothetical protein LBP59_01080 [Planctomycetaceae bacterium]|jgi:hypothetical protein|nr:hypothetical protein [Planctomycetaceae bacterium]
MKKVNLIVGLLKAEVNMNIDFTANVKIGKQGGGGHFVNSEISTKIRIFVTIILWGLLPSLFFLVYLVLLLLSFWL